jgi:hypothetical protein
MSANRIFFPSGEESPVMYGMAHPLNRFFLVAY